MHLYCVRHGQSLFNAEGRIQGQLGSGLSELGRRQSRAAAETLQNRAVEAIYSSPLERALQTAETIGQVLGLEVETDPRLMEINAGILQNQLRTDLDRLYPDVMAHWHSGDPDYRFPEGESRRDLMRRGGAAFRSIRHSGLEHVVVVAHGGLLLAAIKDVTGIPAEENPFSLDNCSITELIWEDDRARLVTVNAIEHLAAIGLGTKGEL
jgi:broad specificity phosphatase PhoE